MKITNSTQAPKPAAASGSTGSARAGGASRQASAGAASVATDPAARLSQLEAQFAQSDFNVGKVSQISADIAAGRYQVDASAVADKLLASTAALSGKSGSAN